MNPAVITNIPIGSLVLSLLVATAISILFYRLDKSLTDQKKWYVVLLTTARTLVLFILFFLLLSPVFTQRKKIIQKPLILLVQDNTESILFNNDSVYYQQEYPESVRRLAVNLGQDYTIHPISFGDSLVDSLLFDYSGKSTAISAAFSEIEKRFSNRNVGAMIFASDGIYNRGKHPVNQASQLRFPVYPVLLGDTSEYPDIWIESIDHNKFAFKGNNFPVRVKVGSNHIDPFESKLKLYQGTNVIAEKSIAFLGEDELSRVDFSLPAETTGLNRYQIVIEPREGEVNTRNNTQEFVIEVLESKQKILILAGAPHPDAGAIKKALAGKENLETSFSLIDDFKGKPEEYNLVILIQLPSAKHAASQVLESIVKNKIPVLFVLGTQSRLDQLNQLQLGWSISRGNNSLNEILPAAVEKFSLFNPGFEEHDVDHLRLPPLIGPFGQVTLQSKADVLFYQKIKSVVSSNPLWTFIQNDDHKIGIIGGEGLWKWRLSNFSQSGDHRFFDNLITKTAQYLALRVKKERFEIRVKKQFTESENIRFFANVYDASFEPLTGPDISLSIKNSDGREFRYILNPGETSYELNIGTFEEGEYTWSASTQLDGQNYIKSGKFLVNPVNTEANQTVANHQLLKQIAYFTGGSSFYPNQLDDLEAAIIQNPDIKPIAKISEKKLSLIHFRWLFFVILFWISFEWLLRKLAGAY